MTQETSNTAGPRGLENTTSSRTIGGVPIDGIDKDGSTLHLVGDNPLETRILRHGEFPERSAATWHFLHDYVGEILKDDAPDHVRKIVENVRIAPLLSRKEKSRVHYRPDSGEVGKTTLYSQVVGVDTLKLADDLGLTELFTMYTSINTGLTSEELWRYSTTYHLTRMISDSNSWLDPEEKLQRLMDAFWDEFSRLNLNRTAAPDLLRAKKLRKKDVLNNNALLSSVDMIESAQAICNYLKEKLATIESSEQESFSKQPARNVMLLLLHLFQTNTQEVTLWWLGVEHGHLHHYNTVSEKIDDPDNEDCPLKTSIIDFDSAEVSPYRLAESDELFSYIEPDKIRDMLEDPKEPTQIKLTLTRYLPLTHWQNSDLEFIKKNAIKKDCLEDILLQTSKQMQREQLPPEQHTLIAEFIYEIESAEQYNWYLPYRHTNVVLESQPNLISSSSKELFQAAQYYEDASTLALISNPSNSQVRLLCSAILHRRTDGYGLETLQVEELLFIFDLATSDTDQTAVSTARNLLQDFLGSHRDTLLNQLIMEASEGNQNSGELFARLFFWLFSSEYDYKTKAVAATLLRNLAANSTLEKALQTLELKNLSSEEQLWLFTKIQELCTNTYILTGWPEEQSIVLEATDVVFTPLLGSWKINQQKVNRLFLGLKSKVKQWRNP